MIMFITTRKRVAARQNNVLEAASTISIQTHSKPVSAASHTLSQAKKQNAYPFPSSKQQGPQGIFMASMLPSLAAYRVD